MIDCTVSVDKKPDPKGDRVLLTFESVFPPSSRNVRNSLSHFQWQVLEVRPVVMLRIQMDWNPGLAHVSLTHGAPVSAMGDCMYCILKILPCRTEGHAFDTHIAEHATVHR